MCKIFPYILYKFDKNLHEFQFYFTWTTSSHALYWLVITLYLHLSTSICGRCMVKGLSSPCPTQFQMTRLTDFLILKRNPFDISNRFYIVPYLLIFYSIFLILFSIHHHSLLHTFSMTSHAFFHTSFSLPYLLIPFSIHYYSLLHCSNIFTSTCTNIFYWKKFCSKIFLIKIKYLLGIVRFVRFPKNRKLNISV